MSDSSGRRPTQKVYRSRAEKGKGKATASEPAVVTQVPPTSNPATFGIKLISDDQHRRFDRLMRRGIVATRYGDPSILGAMGILDNVNELLHSAGLTKCLAPRPTYFRFVLEFFSTLEMRDDSDSCKSKVYSISFRLLNEKRTLRLADLADIYGFSRQSVGDNAGLVGFRIQEFWEQITTAQGLIDHMAYDARSSKLTSIRSPVVKYIQKLLSSTICARKEVSSPRQSEMEILWAIVNRKKRDSLQDLLSCFEKIVKELKVEKQKEAKMPEPVYSGALINPILEHYKIDLPTYTPISQNFFLNWEEMESMKIAMQGYRSGNSGLAVPYVYQNEGPYLRLPNTSLTYIWNLQSRLNLELYSDDHRAHSIEANSEEILKFKRGRTPKPVLRSGAGSTGGGGEGGSSRAVPQPRKRSSAAILSQAEFQERQEERLIALSAEVKEIKESQNKLFQLFQSIKDHLTCKTSDAHRPSRSL